MRILFWPLLMVFISCSNTLVKENAEAVNLDRKIGWMHGGCLAVKDPDITIPLSITLVRLGEVNTLEPATISQKATSGEECFPLMEDRKSTNIESGYSFYLVDTKVPVDLAVGLIGDYEFSRLHFDYCSTSEGVLYSATSGEDTIWQGYYYLGYDSEVTCEDKVSQ